MRNFYQRLASKAKKSSASLSKHFNELGEKYFKKRQLFKAVVFFRQAIALQPNCAWYHQNLGEALAQQGKWMQSLDRYRHALKLNPDEVMRYHNSLNIKPDDSKTVKVPNPVFIVGCGHSGTSIMLAILGNHPNFHSIIDESEIFKKSEAEIRIIMRQWDRECIEASKKRWIEKTPPHIFQIKKFLLHRQQSKFIIMLRDGRDVVCSLKHREEYQDFETRVERWVYDNLAGLPYWDHPNVMVVKYEDLIVETKATLRKIFAFLGESYTDEVLNYHQHQKCWYHSEITEPTKVTTYNRHRQLRNWQINQPLFDGRNKWQSTMTPKEKEIFKTTAQKYLLQFGYVSNDEW